MSALEATVEAISALLKAAPSDGLHDAILRLMLAEFTDTPPLDAVFTDEPGMALILRPIAPRAATAKREGFLLRVAYVQRRMWMLSRQAKGEAYCPPHAKDALMLTTKALICGGTYHALNACDALMRMTYGRPPNTQARTEAAHVAKAAAGALRVMIVNAG